MYTLENIIEKALKKDDDYKLSILVINEGYDEYIERLSYTGHSFFLAQDVFNVQQWSLPTKPTNVYFDSSVHSLGRKTFDAILCFNRAAAYERAIELSSAWHIPLIVIDFASSFIKVPIPFFAQFNLQNPNILFERNGNVNIGSTEVIHQSWQSNLQKMSVYIEMPYSEIKDRKKSGKILIDKYLPQEYISSLPLQIDNNRFTTNPSEGDIYLHLWQGVTPLMIDCMASRIPVITLNSPDFTKIVEKQACILIDDLKMVSNIDFLNQIKNFNNLGLVVNNAEKLVKTNNTQEEFNKKWNNVFKYISKASYIRG